MEEFIEEFKAESSAIIESLQGLMASYEESSSKEAVAEDLFRGIHTLKGTARMFGFDTIEGVTHQLENVLDEHRKLSIPLTPALADITLSVLDFCLQALDRTTTEHSAQIIKDKINSYTIPQTITQEADKTFVYCILLTPDKDLFERGINLLAVFKELEELGTFNTFQSKKAKSIETQVQERSLEFKHIDLWLGTQKPSQDVEDVFMFFKPHEYQIISVDGAKEISDVFENVGSTRGKPLSKSECSLRHEFVDAVSTATLSTPPLEIATVAPLEIPAPDTNRTDTSARLNYINVPLAKLDQMMNLVSEFVTLTGEVKYYASLLGSDGLDTIAERLEKASTGFRDNAFNMRLVPIQILSIKLQRYVKELGQQLEKKVRFITEGMDTEIDKSIINQIEGPLMHIIRNAMDHGLESPAERMTKGKDESGILKLSAFYSGTNVFIHIQDDGAGIDLEKVKAKAVSKGLIGSGDHLSQQAAIDLIFAPGFSTADTTTEISGRGVGMDVVRKNIADLRGSIEVTTEKDLGTSFAIRLPLALSIMDVMIVTVGGLNYLIPDAQIEFCTAAKFTDQVQRKGHNLHYKNRLIPFIELRTIFDTKGQNPSEPSILILTKNDQVVSIEVDEIVGKEQVVIKPVDETLHVIPYLAGTSILGNGELAFLIDVLKLKELYAEK